MRTLHSGQGIQAHRMLLHPPQCDTHLRIGYSVYPCLDRQEASMPHVAVHMLTLHRNSQSYVQLPGSQGSLRMRTLTCIWPTFNLVTSTNLTINRRVPGPTKVCRTTRVEYVSLLLNQIQVKISIQSISQYATQFGATLRSYRSRIIVFSDLAPRKGQVDLLPLLVLIMNAPELADNFKMTNIAYSARMQSLLRQRVIHIRRAQWFE
jgi:hypothetical protein